MSKPKLALIPSGYKSGKVYSILPNDATGDFDFTRQSIGTRVRKDGLIEEAKTSGSITNLILNSEDFSTNWTNFNGASISTDQALAPDGTNTADKIVSNGTNYSFTRPTSNITVTNAKYYTASIYVKADVETVGYLRCDYGTNIYNRKFDLSAGTLSAGFDNTANIPENERIEELANGWYRVSITDIVDTISFEMRIYCADGSASSGDSLFLWGAMVSEGALSDYIKTEGTTETKRVETFTDVPRLDWLNSNCPSLLLEPQRTNLLKYSEDLTNAVWTVLSDGTGSNPVVTSNYSIAPNGTLTADRVVFDKGGGTSGTDYSIIRQFVSGTTQRVSSIYMKSNTNENYNIGVDDVGTVDVVTVTPQWQRFEHSGSAKFRLQLSLRQSQTSDFADVSIWGGQLEDGTYPTSYIKTEASTVTRLKDECYGSGTANLFDTEVGVIYLELKKNGLESSFSGLSLSDGTTSNRIQIRYVADSNTIQVVVRVGGSAVVVLSHTLTDVTERHKIAFKFEADDYAFWVNGAEVGTDTSGALPPNLSEFAFDDGNGANLFFGSVYDARVYTNDLTDTELTELTTL
jgi:hypothetical protein